MVSSKAATEARMSPLRRVRIEDTSAAVEADETDRLQAGEEVLSVEEYQAVEAERAQLLSEDQLSNDRAVERELAHRSEDEDEPMRQHDLGGVGFDRFRKPRRLTEDERRARRELQKRQERQEQEPRRPVAPQFEQACSAAWPYRPSSPYIDVGEAIVELWHGDDVVHEAEALSIQAAGKPRDDRRSDEAARLLRERDPDYDTRRLAAEISSELLRRLFWAFQLEGQEDEAEIRRAIADNLRIAFGSGRGGRPTAECRTIRRALREAIADLYDESRRDLLADALDCSTTALHGLMTKP